MFFQLTYYGFMVLFDALETTIIIITQNVNCTSVIFNRCHAVFAIIINAVEGIVKSVIGEIE